MCENQLSKLITLKNVADFLQFSQLYLANQLEVGILYMAEEYSGFSPVQPALPGQPAGGKGSFIWLKNVADFLQFSQLYLANQVEVRDSYG